jgi:hypothetical protein
MDGGKFKKISGVISSQCLTARYESQLRNAGRDGFVYYCQTGGEKYKANAPDRTPRIGANPHRKIDGVAS